MKVLILGASGMLGNAMIRVMAENSDWQVYGSIRSERAAINFEPHIVERLFTGVTAERHDSVATLLLKIRPDIVINCIGLVKQIDRAKDPVQSIQINSVFPHWLAQVSESCGARVIHFSTDCVFSGNKGAYSETDLPDALDLYGRSKCLGELDYTHTVTLRTSIIGHELYSKHGLVEWFLSQRGSCKGFTNAIFSGFPTVVLSRLVRDVVIPDTRLSGIYHVASNPISKYELLCNIRDAYGKEIEVIPDGGVVIDRSLDAKRFHGITGYTAPEWPGMIAAMHEFHTESRATAQ